MTDTVDHPTAVDPTTVDHPTDPTLPGDARLVPKQTDRRSVEGSLAYGFAAQTGSIPTPPAVSGPLTQVELQAEGPTPIQLAAASAVLARDGVAVAHTRADLLWAPGPPVPVALPGKPSGLGLRKFRDRLTIPPVIRAWAQPGSVPVRIRAQVRRGRFHADLPQTDLWTYEGSSPGPTIEVRRDRTVLIDWVNELQVGGAPARLPYDVVKTPPRTDPVPFNADFAAMWTPGGRSTARGGGPDAYDPIPGTAELTGSTVVHLHGSLTNGHNDGWAHNLAGPGQTQRCEYPNRQEAATLWYHDHAMAVTRFNVHAGLAGFYLIRDAQEAALRLPSGAQELPLAIADRNLETLPPDPARPGGPRFTGRLLYKVAGFTLNGVAGEVPVNGPFTTVNGTIWPTHKVETRWYRLRLLNACNARVLRLALHDTTDEVLTGPVDDKDPAFTANRLPDALVVIGTDGGLLPAPVTPAGGVVELGPGERLDVLVNFGELAGRTLELRNENGTALHANPGQLDATVMQFTVSRTRVRDRWQPPAVLNREYRRYRHNLDGTLQIGDRVVPGHAHVWVGIIPPGLPGSSHPELWELAEVEDGHLVPDGDLIQVQNADGSLTSLHPVAKLFDDATTIRINRGDWVVWHLLHLGGPEHPIHIHMTEFQMINRRQWTPDQLKAFDGGRTTSPLPQPAPGRPIDPVTAGMKDTWVVRPGEWVSVLGHFDGAQGSFMYHCHILDHEDITMMRPFLVLPKDIMTFHGGHGAGHH